jgi:hypothetical protein
METTLEQHMRKTNFTDPGTERSRFLKSNPSTGFREFFVDSTTSTAKNAEVVRWYVISSGKRTTLFRFLFLKWLWDELTSQEWAFCLSLPEFFSSKEFVACARALAAGSSKKRIRDRLNRYQNLVGLKPLSQSEYKSMHGMKYLLSEVIFTDRPAKKFSGWVRHHKDQGSLRVSSIFELEPQGFTEIVEIDLFKVLSVGTVTILNKEVPLSPDDDSRKESKRNSSYSF